MKTFWIGGKNTVLSALNNPSRKLHEIITLRDFPEIDLSRHNKNIKIKSVNEGFFNKIFRDHEINHQGIAANIEPSALVSIQDEVINLRKIVLLDNITDPRNIGSIIRTGVAFGFEALIVKKKGFNSISPVMYKTASGAVESIKIFEVSNLTNTINFLKKNNFWINGLDGKAKDFIHEEKNWQNKNVFILGSEGKGISRLVKESCDNLYKIKISKNTESLNVSNAAAAAFSIFNIKN